MLRKRLVWWSAVPMVCIIVASWSFSIALQGGWLRRSLSAKLAATFGRPVEVAHFGFTILGGPKFEADSVAVGEDERFGQEYFLRADRLTASLRWAALLQGRIEFDRLWLERPSLNLVRSAEGKWNVETWLPPANTQSSLQPYRSPAGVPAHASRIDIEAGRINFKKATEKLPFALVDVSGNLNLQSAGRWSLDLQAHPMRAAVVLQRSGTLRLRGTVGGTSARLQPADLRLNWEGASLADAARLARGTDYGLRGLLDADFAARIDRAEGEGKGSPWKIEGGVRLQAIHRWDLAARPDNPAVNVKLTADWRPAESRLEIERWLVEAPHSNLDGEASIDWSHGFDPQVRLLDSQIGFPDLLNWSRAFLPGRAEDLDIAGSLGLQGNFTGWPLRVEDLAVASNGASVRSNSVKLAPIRIGPVQASWSRSSLVLAPVAVRLSSPASSRGPRGVQAEAVPEGLFHIEGALGPIRASDSVRDWPYRLTISGQTGRLQDLRAVVAALGWQFGSSWNIEGPASLLLVCAGALRPGTSMIHGQLDLHDLRLRNSTIDEPILISAASVEFSPGARSMTIGGAQALGAQWKGGLERKAAKADWTFDLSAERLDIEDLGRGLGQSRQGLLYRILPFAGSLELAPQTEAAIARIGAHGRLHIGALALGALRLESLEATANLERGGLTLRRARADLYGGRLSGEFRAQLDAGLRYSFRGQVDRTDLSALAALTSIKNVFGGIGSGEVELAAHGLGRQALLASLEGEGFLQVQDAEIGLLDLPLDSTDNSLRDMAGSRFRNSTVSFRVEGGRIRVDPWLLSGRQRQLEIVGAIDFSRRLDLQVRSLSQSERLGPVSDSPSGDDVWVIGGTLDAPQVIRQERVSAGNQTITRTGRR
jgi:uncharacterized protein involved in outer membrane biogenesis